MFLSVCQWRSGRKGTREKARGRPGDERGGTADKVGMATSASATVPPHPSSHPGYSPSRSATSHGPPRSVKPHARSQRPSETDPDTSFLIRHRGPRLSARWARPVEGRGGRRGGVEEREGWKERRTKGSRDGGSGRTNHGNKVKSGQVTQSLRDLCYRKKWLVKPGNNEREERIL